MIEDDLDLSSLLEDYLGKYGFELFSVALPSVALEKLKIEKFDLILLDLTLPQMDGLELLLLIKEIEPQIPIIISTARDDTTDKVIGYGSGADDYISKPYDPRELVARIQYHIKKNTNFTEKPSSKLFQIDEQKFIITKDSEDLGLTLAEFELFSLLIKNSHKVLSREYIINSVNAIDWESSDKSINVIIGRIRTKIDDDIKKPKYIKTLRGAGYQYIGDR